jgi:putative transposase
MQYDPPRHHRRSIRLRGYDYAQGGMYYVTLTIQDREDILGSAIGDKIELSSFGEIALEEWERTPIVRPEVMLDKFVIMPDHLHGIIVICEERNGVTLSLSTLVGANRHSPQRLTPFRSPSRTLGAIIWGFKGASTKRINAQRGTPGERLWQRNYYEHIIRDEKDYRRIQKYILENPSCLTLKSESMIAL